MADPCVQLSRTCVAQIVGIWAASHSHRISSCTSRGVRIALDGEVTATTMTPTRSEAIAARASREAIESATVSISYDAEFIAPIFASGLQCVMSSARCAKERPPRQRTHNDGRGAVIGPAP